MSLRLSSSVIAPATNVMTAAAGAPPVGPWPPLPDEGSASAWWNGVGVDGAGAVGDTAAGLTWLIGVGGTGVGFEP
jgi:hypothetical protein